MQLTEWMKCAGTLYTRSHFSVTFKSDIAMSSNN